MNTERMDLPGLHVLLKGMVLLASSCTALSALVILRQPRLPSALALVPILIVTLINFALPVWRSRTVRAVSEGLALGEGRRARLVRWGEITGLRSLLIEGLFYVQPRELLLSDGSAVVFFSDSQRYRRLQRLLDLH
ncbi:MAG: hypothetical protein IPG96_18005 [Proteobacteria bacterium]|nr:hypothetical protein [Pseudomonadota bacterium]